MSVRVPAALLLLELERGVCVVVCVRDAMLGFVWSVYGLCVCGYVCARAFAVLEMLTSVEVWHQGCLCVCVRVFMCSCIYCV